MVVRGGQTFNGPQFPLGIAKTVSTLIFHLLNINFLPRCEPDRKVSPLYTWNLYISGGTRRGLVCSVDAKECFGDNGWILIHIAVTVWQLSVGTFDMMILAALSWLLLAIPSR